ncbi:DUF1045 domain-containing protein [Fodinicurvata halophila]|uniref:DUF1045 domain-containing protein n=1 Tax=Fodinicurvata halophila TaxID=1419723 RepID=A0ABV8UL94_9PROT
MSERYAVYFTPPRDSALRRLAGQWLGYDPHDGALPRSADAFGLDRGIVEDVTGTPRVYGFHATLKPPFRLARGHDESALHEAVATLARQFRTFPMPYLGLSRLGGFLALLPEAPEPRLDDIAGACVERLDRFRAAPHPEDLARRRATGLSARQEALLQRWGYPYVFDEFRFHMTLTRALDEAEHARVAPILAQALEPVLARPLAFDALSLMRQRTAREPFTEIARLPLS